MYCDVHRLTNAHSKPPAQQAPSTTAIDTNDASASLAKTRCDSKYRPVCACVVDPGSSACVNHHFTVCFVLMDTCMPCRCVIVFCPRFEHTLTHHLGVGGWQCGRGRRPRRNTRGWTSGTQPRGQRCGGRRPPLRLAVAASSRRSCWLSTDGQWWPGQLWLLWVCGCGCGCGSCGCGCGSCGCGCGCGCGSCGCGCSLVVVVVVMVDLGRWAVIVSHTYAPQQRRSIAQ